MDKETRKEKRSKIYGHPMAKEILDMFENTGKIDFLEKRFVKRHILTCTECRNRYQAFFTPVSDN